jgi:hypothetical protein
MAEDVHAPCLCGCGGTPKGDKARFVVGHDAKLKGRLLNEASGGDGKAFARLKELGWESHWKTRAENDGAKAKKRHEAGLEKQVRDTVRKDEKAKKKAGVPTNSDKKVLEPGTQVEFSLGKGMLVGKVLDSMTRADGVPMVKIGYGDHTYMREAVNVTPAQKVEVAA